LPKTTSASRAATSTADADTGAARSWAGVPAADRRAERRRLLLDAALELLGTDGWAGTTVRGVCQTARLNPRYFYESFDDLDALVVALYDRLIGELREELVAAIDGSGDDPDAQTRAALDRIVGFVVDDPRRARVLYVEALGNEALNRRRIETGHAVVTFVQEFAQARAGTRNDDPIGTIGAAIAVGGTSEMILAWLDGRIDCSREQLVDDATVLFRAIGRAAESTVAERRRPTRSSRSST
jgi:AcrR family transcriptional regulator